MNRSFFAGVGCSLAALVGLVLFVALFGDNARRLFGASSDAMAGTSAPQAAKRLRSFGQNPAFEGELEAVADAPGMAPPVMEMLERAGGGMPMAAKTLGGARADLARKGGGGEDDDATPSRAWFPETFLFEPLVVTDASGAATVPVRVPDRLTQWRVLALAHSRSGAQSGTVTSFTGTLPTYVDPVLPAFLRAGDAVRMPVQVMNTTDAAVEAPLKVEVPGALVEGGSRTVRVPARGSVVEYVTVRVSTPGQVAVRAALGATDAVVRDFPVWSTGRPVVETRGGTLAAPRSLALTGAVDAQPGSERVRVRVFPGGLGVLRSELLNASAREDAAGVGYALLLTGRAPELLAALGETRSAEALKALRTPGQRLTAPVPPAPGEVDVESVRAGLVRATQRALRWGRAPDVATAALLAEGALAHPDNPVLARLGERLAAQVAAAQLPDGTCQGGNGWTLQRLLVATADCTRAVSAAAVTPEGKRRAAFFTARASGALERNRAHVKDGYTAAALLASGAVTGSLRDSLREQVRAAVQRRDEGAAFLPVEEGVVDATGRAPTEAEATALAVLALESDTKAPVADLGAALLASYEPVNGWGDGRANRLALQAVVALFREPLPAQVRVVLERDGQVITEGTFDAKALREVMSLDAAAPGSGGAHTWTVRAEPAVPGLGFALALSAAVPWTQQSQAGLELSVQVPSDAKVGQPSEVALQASTPSGLPLVIRHGLPAGVQVDTASLEALVREGKVAAWESEDGAVTLRLHPRGPGEPFQARFRVIPTLAGTLQGGASSLMAPSRPDLVSYVPPATWAVR